MIVIVGNTGPLEEEVWVLHFLTNQIYQYSCKVNNEKVKMVKVEEVLIKLDLGQLKRKKKKIVELC